MADDDLRLLSFIRGVRAEELAINGMVLWVMVLDPTTTSMTACLNFRPTNILSGA